MLTVSDQLDEVLHRLLQADSVKHHRFEVPVLERPDEANSDDGSVGHVRAARLPSTGADPSGRRPLSRWSSVLLETLAGVAPVSRTRSGFKATWFPGVTTDQKSRECSGNETR
ncbi:hypothetical protein F2P81_020752 [Scophthalmus maximus]|uniref:Uncharacterized protein n=1 Tax=Scophthalmus maximus TaxID=52904 RepID=A0A6A4S186_SCOMX|nr:hypothetical protein F2P81_020752 [Scophthalmus maximus]